MLLIVSMSAASVAACLLTLSRVIGWGYILRYATVIDVAFTLALGAFFFGTLTGALVAVLGGLFMAITLSALRAVRKLYERATETDPDSEYVNGVWVYNTAPYIKPTEWAQIARTENNHAL